jgi:hypothetical protein
MNVTETTIPIIEKALRIKLYEGQVEYILNGKYYNLILTI